MIVTDIPFNKHIGLTTSESDPNRLELSMSEHLRNHLGTFHAGAQFALAEACSGLCLQNRFPELKDSVIPVLRKSDVKFRQPANESITASATIEEQELSSFQSQFERKGRGTIEVQVEVRDRSDNVTMTGAFQWFVQAMEA